MLPSLCVLQVVCVINRERCSTGGSVLSDLSFDHLMIIEKKKTVCCINIHNAFSLSTFFLVMQSTGDHLSLFTESTVV